MAGCCTKQDCKAGLRNNLLLLLTLLAVAVGIALGIGLRYVDLGYDGVAWISIWGELFMNMLKAIVLPLVATCVISGIASIDRSSANRLGAITFTWIFSTNLLGAIMGVVLALAIKPGSYMNTEEPVDELQYTSYTDIFQDLLRNLFPNNIIQMTFQSVNTIHDVTWANVSANSSNGVTWAMQIQSVGRTKEFRYALDTLGLVIVSVAFGLGAFAAQEQAEPFLAVIRSINAVVVKILFAIFWYSPIGICSLVAKALVTSDNLEAVVISLSMFVVTFVVGFVIHALIFMPLLYLIICRKNPFVYLGNIMDGLVAGFATTSMAAALPFLLEGIKKKNNINAELTNFVLPLEITSNKDGSVMFIACTSVFMAQAQGIILLPQDYIIIILLSFLMAVTVATVPSASIVVLIVVCSAVEIPTEKMVAYVMVTEFLLDRLRTVNNTTSTAFGPAIVQRFLPKLNEKAAIDGYSNNVNAAYEGDEKKYIDYCSEL